ncbi:hypothetical protein P170DRAFT_409761 [Aspergillus steynii IBT 23096]|uniref:Arylsulfotransferase n=1 Tax=Aspergillus steynii IBT 23096 TaxID=1392250 RepID=A0A2I2G3Y0_9EURO|nr:uncharacterized protein P170DRAFT_409761 [Aspergillus steynii IBT 23096]PLB47578.1 hypothetical protein P170DRAFT_409761 [Aspergillus steynii IBT 23096]
MASQSVLYLLLALFTLVTTDVAPLTDFVAYQGGQYGLRPNQTYHTSNVTSPIFLVNTWERDLVDNASHVFLGYAPDPETGAVMIFSADDLSLVWFEELSREKVNTPRIARFRENDYLLYWIGEQVRGHGDGKWLMLNSSYDVVYTITTGGLAVGADIHECRLTDEETALITAYNPIPFDLSGVGGTNNDTLLDSVFQEVDVVTGRVLFTWNAIDHFSIEDSCAPYEKEPIGWDWCHINSIQKTHDRNYVVSFSVCSLIVHINGTDGNPIWVMGGKKNQFTDSGTGKAPDFAFQHHALFHDMELQHLTMFDNHVPTTSYPCVLDCSAARFFTVDYATMSISSGRQLPHPKGLRSRTMGSAELLDGGNMLVGWGFNAALTEHTTDGRVAWDVQFGVLGSTLGSYRVYKMNWKGYPTTDPSIVVRRQSASSSEILYVSWNGATEVRRWILLACSSVNPLNQVAMVNAVPRAGFETAILVDSPARYVRAVGLDGQGDVLGMSAVWDRESGTVVKIKSHWPFRRLVVR